MWYISGTESPVDFNHPTDQTIFDFVPSDHITENDFNNISKTFLVYNDTVSDGFGGAIFSANSLSFYISAAGSRHSNLIDHTRWNIVHPNWVDNIKTYFYDGCAYEWTLGTPGTQVYQFKTYSQGNNTYTYSPKLSYSHWTQNEITKEKVLSIRLVATKGNTSAGIGIVRPLFGIDLSAYSSLYNIAEHPVQFFLGPIIPPGTINEWLKNRTIYNSEAPNKETGKADEADGKSNNFNWQNRFKIMNFDELDNADSLWPEHMLIDELWRGGGVSVQEYMVWNDDNDPNMTYHGYGFNNGATLRLYEQRINDTQLELGSSIDSVYITGTATGKFCTNNSAIDQFTDGNYYAMTPNGPDYIRIGNGMGLDFDLYNPPDPGDIIFDQWNTKFAININYANKGVAYLTRAASGSNDYYIFNDLMIIRHGGEYYLGGVFHFSKLNDLAWCGFCILCRITLLTRMDNYDGGQPGDPVDTGDEFRDGLSALEMSNIFGPGDNGTANPTTQSVENGYIGDSADIDGSAYNPDGSARDPEKENTGGTGEKNSHPVDNDQVTNHHDGSVGNGTGDAHQNDAKVDDPSSSLPSGVDTSGTVSGSGVLSVFTPSVAELTSFTSELLSNTVLDSIKNYFTTNPMDGIFALHILPYSGFSSNLVANPRIGTHTFTSTLTMAASEFITVDYGSMYVPFVYDGYENYAPLSDAKIFLPYIGMKDIDINIIQGCNIKLKYNISLVTGDIYAYLYAQWAAKWGKAETNQGVDHLIYHWQGNCASTVPLSHLDSTNYISGAMQIAGGITSLVAGAATANPVAIPAGIAGMTKGVAEMGRTSIISSGNISGTAAFMGCKEAYLLISRPIMTFSNAYNRYIGNRANAIEMIGSLAVNTFTMMRNVDLAGINATGEELAEIETILKGGFYI